MELIENIISAIFMNEEGIEYIDRKNTKILISAFLVIKVLISLLLDSVSFIIDGANVLKSLVYAGQTLLWNLLLNAVLAGSLYGIIYMKTRRVSPSLLKCVLAMNFIDPVISVLSLFCPLLFLELFVIIYDILFIQKYMRTACKTYGITDKQGLLYTVIAFLFVFVILCFFERIWLLPLSVIV